MTVIVSKFGCLCHNLYNKSCFGESETRNGYGIRFHQEELTFGELAAHGQPTVLFLGLLKLVSGWLELDQKRPCVVCMRLEMKLLLLLLLLSFKIHDLYCFIRVRFSPEKFYFFSVPFIVNELKSNHFLTSEIFIKISPLKSLEMYHPEICKILWLSQNSTKCFWVTRFRETNLTAQSVSSSEI